jgi:hypothetical protein
VAFRLAEKGPAILLESLEVTGDTTFPILLDAPNIGLIRVESANADFASLKGQLVEQDKIWGKHNMSANRCKSIAIEESRKFGTSFSSTW